MVCLGSRMAQLVQYVLMLILFPRLGVDIIICLAFGGEKEQW